jgi:predicted kinase
MIINVRGTSGSGKSTLVRRVLAHYPHSEKHFREGRKQPFAYTYHRPDGPSIYVIGHYETACGGGDTIPSIDEVYELIRAGLADGKDVIYEGLVIQSDTRRCIELHQAGHPLCVISLNTSLDECEASITARRQARGNMTPLRREIPPEEYRSLGTGTKKWLKKGVAIGMINTAVKWDTCTRLHPPKFKDAGVDFHLVSRDEAYLLACDRLGLSARAAQDVSETPVG